MICLSPWHYYRGGRVVVEKFLLTVKKISLGVSMPRDVVYVIIRDVRFGVTGWYSDFGGRFSLP